MVQNTIQCNRSCIVQVTYRGKILLKPKTSIAANESKWKLSKPTGIESRPSTIGSFCSAGKAMKLKQKTCKTFRSK